MPVHILVEQIAERPRTPRITGLRAEGAQPHVIAGFDLDQLSTYAGQLQRALADSPRFADVKSTVEAGNPEIQILFDQERAARLGLVVRDVADVVDTVAEANVRLTMDNIRKLSPVLRIMEEEGEIIIAGAMYDISSGEVRFMTS